MKFKKSMASLLAAAVLGSAASVPSAAADDGNESWLKPWLNLGLISSKRYVRPGETFDVSVTSNKFGTVNNISGVQVKICSENEDLVLKEISKSSKAFGVDTVESNTETGEAAFYVSKEGKVPEDGADIITYTYQVPADAPEGTSYVLRIDWNFTAFSDENGDEVQYENMTYCMVDVNSERVEQNLVYFKADNQTETTPKPGDTFEMSVVLAGEKASTIDGVQMKLNSKGVSIEELVEGSTPKDTMVEFNPETNELAIASKNGKALTGDNGGTIAKLKVRISKDFNDDRIIVSASDVTVIDTEDVQKELTEDGNSVSLGVVKVVRLSGLMLGDVNFDKYVDASDASDILSEYAALSTNQNTTFKTIPDQKLAADVNFDGLVDASDASLVLAYYSFMSTGGSGDMANWLKGQGKEVPSEFLS